MMPTMQQRGLPRLLKRAIDRGLAGVAVVVTAPVIAAAAVAVRRTMGAPAFFTQTRAGLGGAPFRIRKLRTMSDARDASGALLPDAERLTPVGRFLRASSIDELPQLWNVLAGDLSLVGPRPLLMDYLPLYSPEQARRHEVLPGITGWAQIHGRNATTWPARLAHDVWYVDHWSVLLDLRIIARTALAVLRRDGISNEGAATMPRFSGER